MKISNTALRPALLFALSLIIASCKFSASSSPKDGHRTPSNFGEVKEYCGAVVSNEKGVALWQKHLDPPRVWDLNPVDGDPIRLYTSSPWYYCTCISGTTALNPPRFESVHYDEEDSQEEPEFPEKECRKFLIGDTETVPDREQLVQEIVNELKPRVKTINRSFLAFNYRTKRGGTTGSTERYLKQLVSVFWSKKQKEDGEQIKQDAKGLYMAADPFISRNFGGGKDEFVLTLMPMNVGKTYLDIRQNGYLSEKLTTKLWKFGCLVPPSDGEQMRAVLMQTSRGNCRGIALSALKRLKVSSLWYGYTGILGKEAYVPQCSNPQTAIVILQEDAFGAETTLIGDSTVTDGNGKLRSIIQKLSTFVETYEGTDITGGLWPEIKPAQKSDAVSWAKKNLLGCMK